MTRWTQAQVDAVRRERGGTVWAANDNGVIRSPRLRNGNVSTAGFASKREAKCFEDLKLRQQAGEIYDLKNNRDHKEACTFELIPAQYNEAGICVERACKYIADFTWIEDGKLVAADAKGFREPIYRIKRKIFRQRYGFGIREL